MKRTSSLKTSPLVLPIRITAVPALVMVTGPLNVLLPAQKSLAPPVFVNDSVPWKVVFVKVGMLGALIPPPETTPPENEERVVVVSVNPLRSRVPADTLSTEMLRAASNLQMLGTASELMFTVLPGPGIPLGVQLVLVFQAADVAPFQENVWA